ncbi:MAG: DUF1826 domain-containing protein [Bacteroidota bacterium]
MESATHTGRHLRCNNWAEMSAICESDNNLAYWPRQKDTEITRFLDALTKLDTPPEAFKESLLAPQMSEHLAAHLAPFSKGHEEGFQRLIADVHELATSFATLASSPKLRATFTLISNDMCRLFHTDAIELRLLCTYIGPGTLWVPDQYVNWDNMRESTNEARVRDLRQVQQFSPFEVGILKGAMYEANDGPAVLHRSPTLTTQETTRVLLRLDSQLAW